MVCHFMGRVKLIHVQLLGKSCMEKLQWSIDFIFLYVAIWSVLRVNKLNVTSFPLGLYASFSTRGYQFKTEVQCMEAVRFMLFKVIFWQMSMLGKVFHCGILLYLCDLYFWFKQEVASHLTVVRARIMILSPNVNVRGGLSFLYIAWPLWPLLLVQTGSSSSFKNGKS